MLATGLAAADAAALPAGFAAAEADAAGLGLAAAEVAAAGEEAAGTELAGADAPPQAAPINADARMTAGKLAVLGRIGTS
ncbi:MAG: hypothetical protein JO247_18865 [Chloroflexi bacterium]|nr:hypothetical protein [Chloroflexota bacterium]